MQDEYPVAPRGWQMVVLNGLALLVLALAVAIGVQVLCSFFNINPLLQFNDPVLLFGTAVTLNSLLDLQWHFLCLIALLSAGIVWLRNDHIRVDILYTKLSPRRQALIEITGHVIFTAPFLLMSIPAAWGFMMSAYRSGQGSSNDGLNNLFLIKATLPLGLILLAVVVVWDFIVQIRRWRCS
ncbi:MAG: TRAP transporter small permease subunit [Pseudomonadota bacterium]